MTRPRYYIYKGNVKSLKAPNIAVVGARKMSLYGKKNTIKFCSELVQHRFNITSGMAIGVDTIAHQSAINTNGITIAIMGTGLNTCYPKSNKLLAQNILDTNGALISELPLDTNVKKINFPRRNRLISGISLGTIIIECTLKSGSLITARYANEQGAGDIYYPRGYLQPP